MTQHDDSVDCEVLWRVVTIDLPTLVATLEKVADEQSP